MTWLPTSLSPRRKTCLLDWAITRLMTLLPAAKARLIFAIDLRFETFVGHVAFFTTVHARHVLHAARGSSRPIALIAPLALLSLPRTELLLEAAAHDRQHGGLRVLVSTRITHLIKQVGLLRDPINVYLLIIIATSAIRQRLELPDQLLLVHNIKTIQHAFGALLLVLQYLDIADGPGFDFSIRIKRFLLKP